MLFINLVYNLLTKRSKHEHRDGSRVPNKWINEVIIAIIASPYLVHTQGGLICGRLEYIVSGSNRISEKRDDYI